MRDDLLEFRQPAAVGAVSCEMLRQKFLVGLMGDPARSRQSVLALGSVVAPVEDMPPAIAPSDLVDEPLLAHPREVRSQGVGNRLPAMHQVQDEEILRRERGQTLVADPLDEADEGRVRQRSVQRQRDPVRSRARVVRQRLAVPHRSRPAQEQETGSSRGFRECVEHALGTLAAGDPPETILAGYPWLAPEDIQACLVVYAGRVVGHERVEPALGGRAD